MKQGRFESILIKVVVFRFITLIPKAFLPFTLPEVWRQSVTLGVTIRYWNRWMYESGPSGKIFPAVLDAYNGTGIMPMEAPILNAVFAPFFGFGPQVGRIAAILAITALQFGLLYAAHRVWRPRFGWALLILPFFSFTFGWFGKFTPDLVAMLITLIGVGILVERKLGPKPRLLPSILIALGCLMKPTSVAVLALLLFDDEKRESRFSKKLVWLGRKYAISAGIPVTLAVAYYLFANPWIDTFRDTVAQFPVGFRSPVETLHGIAASPWSYFGIFHRRFFVPYLIYPMALLGFLAWAEERRDQGTGEFPKAKDWRAIGWVATAQVIFLTFLSGVHVFDHEYYFYRARADRRRHFHARFDHLSEDDQPQSKLPLLEVRAGCDFCISHHPELRSDMDRI